MRYQSIPRGRARQAAARAGAGLVLSLALALPATAAASADFVYEPVNPSFGGNPLNSSHLLGLADRQNQHKEGSGGAAGGYGNSPADQFVRQLQSRMMSSLANQVNDAIFGENAAESGTIVFGDQTITFERGLEGVHMVINDTGTGSRTEITVPLLQLE